VITRRAATAGLLSLAAGPANAAIGPKTDAPVTINFYNYNLATAGLGGDATRELIAGFMTENPSIKVTGVAVPSNDMATRVQADIAAGRTPDVAQLIFNDLDFIVNALAVPALDDIVPKQEWAAHTAGMVPAGLQLGALSGKIYGLAYTFSTPILFYNADVFRAAGLNPDMPPKTWGEVKAAGLAIVQKTAKGGVFPSIFSQFDWVYQAIVLSNGGRVLSEDRRKLMFADPAAVEAVAVMRDLVRSGAMPKIPEGDATDQMMAGNLGMLLTTSAYQRAMLAASKGKWELRAAPMPAFGDKPTHPTNSGSALFIMSKDPAKQRAAWELMKYLTSKLGYTIITSKIGYLPLRLDIVDDPAYLGAWTRENPLVRPNLVQLAKLARWESMPGANYRQIGKIEMAAVNEAVFGDGDPGQILRAAQGRAQALMPR